MKAPLPEPAIRAEDPLTGRRDATNTPEVHAGSLPDRPGDPGSELAQVESRAPERGSWASMLGLHPLVAFGMVAVDMMLFGGEAATGGAGLVVTVPVALALTVPCVLLQRYSFGDNWGAALGKGLMVGVLTAIPLPIGSPVTILGAILGWRRNKPSK